MNTLKLLKQSQIKNLNNILNITKQSNYHFSSSIQQQNQKNEMQNNDQDLNNQNQNLKEYEQPEFQGHTNKSKNYYNKSRPNFQMLDAFHIEDYTHLSQNLHINSPWRWTPLIQQQYQLTDDRKFRRQMRYFQNLRYFEEEQEKELIDTLLYTALQGTDFDYYYDYQAEGKKWFGNIDYLIYNKNSDNQLPLIPVIRAKKYLNKDIGKYESYFNIYEAIGAGMWAFNSTKARNPQMKHVRALLTNGNQWQMIQIGNDASFERTHIYKSENDQYFKLYNDVDMQSLALGIIRFSLDSPRLEEQALKKVYDFIDEKRFLTEQDEQTKRAFQNKQKYYFFLPKSIREFFFKAN